MTMYLSTLPKITKRSKKRVGRGFGSGKGGHTAGRGRKGQRSREDIPLLFEGAPSGASLVKRLPFLRGKGKHKSFKKNPVVINTKYLNLLPKNTKVDAAALVKYHLVDDDAANRGVKILGEGTLTVPLNVHLPCSKGAKKIIEAAGGTVTT